MKRPFLTIAKSYEIPQIRFFDVGKQYYYILGLIYVHMCG